MVTTNNVPKYLRLYLYKLGNMLEKRKTVFNLLFFIQGEPIKYMQYYACVIK